MFSPEKITREHILEAIADVEKQNLQLIPSTKFDLFYEGKHYPPKEIMRLAHEKATGSYDWYAGGGEPTNKYLTRFGFEIVKKEKNVNNNEGNNQDIDALLEGAQFITICPTHIGGRKPYSWEKFKEGGYVALGWNHEDYSNLSKDEIIDCLKKFKYENEREAIDAYSKMCSLNIGDIVAVVNNNKGIFGIGRITSPLQYCKYKHDTGTEDKEEWYSTYWSVEWLHTNYEKRVDVIAPGERAWEPYGTVGKLYSNVPNYIKRILQGKREISVIMVNITWNSKGWQGLSEDKSNFGRPRDEGITPGESWNFDFDHSRNSNGRIWGYAQFTHAPKVEGSNNLIIFYSNGQIVGFYGKAEVLKDENRDEEEFLVNLSGDQSMSLVLPVKIQQVKEKGYFETKERVGRVGFIYLEQKTTVNQILDEALQLNPEAKVKLTRLKDWFNGGRLTTVKDWDTESVHPYLNLLLYGPPGTGKTYQTMNLAVAIAEDITEEDAQEKYTKRSDLKARYDILVSQGIIDFVTFHQNYSYEDFVKGIKPTVGGGTHGLQFEEKEGIFYRICESARRNFLLSSRQAGKVNSDFTLVFDDFVEPLETGKVSQIAINGPHHTFYLTDIDRISGRIAYLRKSTKKESYILIDNVRKFYEGLSNFESHGDLTYIKALANKLKESTKFNEIRPLEEQRKNYVLIIDEINRANISRVFGELITLLEKDKRLGGENALEVTLPSGERFSVPPNLYVLGTMNTADKSIALLDIALRRRFHFIPMYPNAGLVTDVKLKGVLTALNDAILKKKGSADFLIGHSFFMNRNADDLADILNHNIIPLLYEYFMNRSQDVKEVLTQAGIGTVEEYGRIVYHG